MSSSSKPEDWILALRVFTKDTLGTAWQIREMEFWKYEEIFRVKTGKNEGKWEKKPKFDKYLKVFREKCSLAWNREKFCKISS